MHADGAATPQIPCEEPSPAWEGAGPDAWRRKAGDLEVRLSSDGQHSWQVSVYDGDMAQGSPATFISRERAVRDACTAFEACELIATAVDAGVILAAADKREVLKAWRECRELRARANGSSASDDPMRKGTAFPMGVGFTRMTRRAEQRIDASVRRAGENVALYRKADSLERYAKGLLAGEGTTADKARRQNNQQAFQRKALAMLLDQPKGKLLGQFVIERVNLSRDGYPSSYTCTGPGLHKGVNDKFDVARVLFAGDRKALERMVDEIRSEHAASTASDDGAPEAAHEPARARERG